MRILLLAHAPSIHAQRWARAFTERGHEVRLLTLVPAPQAPHPGEPIGNPEAPMPFLRYAGGRSAVRDVIAAWNPAVTVAHFLPNYGFLAALAGARPLALVAWGSDLLVNPHRTPLHRARAHWVLERSDLIHVDAVNLAEAARALGASPERIWIRPWGVETAALKADRPWSERRRRAGGLRILWSRMLEPLYDPDTFLRALVALHRRGVSFLATIAGRGPLATSLEGTVRREGLADVVRFVGLVDEPGMRELLRGHEVYVSMSRSDSTSQSLLESMAAGLYPIVSDIAGNRPWIGSRERPEVRYSERGILVRPGDAAGLAEAIEAVDADTAADDRVARGAALVGAEADWDGTVAQAESRLLALVRSGTWRS